ncbi:hypothetical protein EVAR_31301_1 [Eumeta japonica]|uniref:Uncharacterized protein n=1 Tax=Eumeta variegata TaxID=151549 RepID=A0A4C1VPW5_EUMVA|nr:hypothetical protein EVAR_31301_1 [Eumeta japonica]
MCVLEGSPGVVLENIMQTKLVVCQTNLVSATLGGSVELSSAAPAGAAREDRLLRNTELSKSNEHRTSYLYKLSTEYIFFDLTATAARSPLPARAQSAASHLHNYSELIGDY